MDQNQHHTSTLWVRPREEGARLGLGSAKREAEMEESKAWRRGGVGPALGGGRRPKEGAALERSCCTLIDAKVWRELKERERFKRSD